METYLEWSTKCGGSISEYQEYAREYARQQRTGTDPVVAGIAAKMYGDSEPERTWKKDEISELVNAGVQLVFNDGKPKMVDVKVLTTNYSGEDGN